MDEDAKGCLGTLLLLAFLGWIASAIYHYLFSPQGQPVKVAVEIILLGAATVGAIYWQYRLLQNDDKGFPKRLVLTIIVLSFVFAGVLVRGIMKLSDDQVHGYSLSNLFVEIFTVLVFAVIYAIKNYLGPVVLGLAVISVIYHGFEYEKWWMIRSVWGIIELILPSIPHYFEAIYTIVAITSAIVGSTWDHFDANWV